MNLYETEVESEDIDVRLVVAKGQGWERDGFAGLEVGRCRCIQDRLKTKSHCITENILNIN